MRRRRTRGTWFPNIGTEVVELEDTASGREFQVFINSPSIVTGILSLTLDTPFEGEGVAAGVDSLADIIGSEYVLQRIVGKLLIGRNATIVAAADPEPALLVSCGFFVARANDAASGGGQDTPIGSATEAERRDNYSPLELDTVREPWIWRRTWILGAAGKAIATAGIITSVTQPEARNFPSSTALYGSVADGPHIDSRVKRRVGQDNRLWFAVSANTWPVGSATSGGNALSLRGYLDYRIFGSLRKARNTSAF